MSYQCRPPLKHQQGPQARPIAYLLYLLVALLVPLPVVAQSPTAPGSPALQGSALDLAAMALTPTDVEAAGLDGYGVGNAVMAASPDVAAEFLLLRLIRFRRPARQPGILPGRKASDPAIEPVQFPKQLVFAGTLGISERASHQVIQQSASHPGFEISPGLMLAARPRGNGRQMPKRGKVLSRADPA